MPAQMPFNWSDYINSLIQQQTPTQPQGGTTNPDGTVNVGKGRNPVPASTVPAAGKGPSKIYRKMADQVQAVVDLLPYYSGAQISQVGPQAEAILKATQDTNAGYNELSRNNAIYQTGTDAAALAEAQKSLIPEALKAAKMYDPEYFATRELTSSRLKDLMNSIDLSGGLSPTERMEIERSQAQEGQRRGTGNAPSNLATVENAMQFGNAGYNRQQQAKSNLSTAIANATAALPTFKSGTDVFQVATGKPSQPNPAFGAAANANASGMADNLMNNSTALRQTIMGIDSQKKDWADYLGQVTSSIGNIVGAVGVCWVARRVYGSNNPKWKEFRHWLITQASKDLCQYYLIRGKEVAEKIKEEDIPYLRVVMDTAINQLTLNYNN